MISLLSYIMLSDAYARCDAVTLHRGGHEPTVSHPTNNALQTIIITTGMTWW